MHKFKAASKDHPARAAYSRINRIAYYLNTDARSRGVEPVSVEILEMLGRAQQIIRLEAELAGVDIGCGWAMEPTVAGTAAAANLEVAA